MKDIYTNLLRLALAAGLTQRELFIEKLSAFLSEKTDSSPENGERIAAGLVSLAESLKGICDEVYLVGDADEPHRIADATKAGYVAGCAI